jgi:hypothetical protein
VATLVVGYDGTDGAQAALSTAERPLKSALVGSTPTWLLHLSERPVLVVRAPDRRLFRRAGLHAAPGLGYAERRMAPLAALRLLLLPLRGE